MGRRCRNLSTDESNVRHIVLIHRRIEGDPPKGAAGQGLGGIGRETQSAAGLPGGDQLGQSGLVQWRPARPEVFHDSGLGIETDDLKAGFGQATGRHAPQVPQSLYSDSHGSSR